MASFFSQCEGALSAFIYGTGQTISRLCHHLMRITHVIRCFFLVLSCSDVLFVSKIPVGYMLAWYNGCHKQPYSKAGMSKVCLSVCVCVFSEWKIRPQKMLIRVDLGTWSCRLMDRVQGQTSPWGAMILSLIVHTHTSPPR